MAELERENGGTPARLAIPSWPSFQCIASAARHGMAISSAIFDHISDMYLFRVDKCLYIKAEVGE